MRNWLVAISCVLVLVLAHGGLCQTNARTEVKIPDIPGYVTLACDFHAHTVFSDGRVWPTVRPEEAWMEGLDALAITDHVDYRPHKDDMKTEDCNRPFELARESAAEHQILLIRGGELARDMPPGHFNAIFLQDANALNKKDYKEAIKAAVDQGAFVFWNHPGWQEPDIIPTWHPEHTELLNNGWMHGMEIVNDQDYYPKAFQWCLEKNITMLGNSDVHSPIQMAFDFQNGGHRPMTLVFATEKSEKAIKEALFARRTAVYNGKYLLGREEYLKPIFEASVRIRSYYVKKGEIGLEIQNGSCVTFELRSAGEVENVTFAGQLTLYAGKTALSGVKIGEKQPPAEEIVLPYVVKNVLIGPDTGLPVQLKVAVPSEK